MLFSDGGGTEEARGVSPSLWEHEVLFIGVSRCSRSADGDPVLHFLLLGLWWQRIYNQVCCDVFAALGPQFPPPRWDILMGNTCRRRQELSQETAATPRAMGTRAPIFAIWQQLKSHHWPFIDTRDTDLSQFDPTEFLLNFPLHSENWF